MNSVSDFIVSPLGLRYDNEIKVGKKKLITNASIESYKHVNNIAKVISTPIIDSSNIKKGDLVLIHHNVFRRFYDIRGKEKNSKSYFKDNLFFCSTDQIYLYKTKKKLEIFWRSLLRKAYS